MTRNAMVSPSLRTSLGCSIRVSLISEMWIRPSMSLSRRANAPNLVRRVITPSTNWPTLNFSTRSRQGSSLSARRLNPIRFFSRSILITLTLTSCPTARISLGCWMRSQESSERCTRPSAPLMLTNAPNSARLVTRPLCISPSCNSSITRSLIAWRDSLLAARSEQIRRRRDLSTSMMRTEIGSPIILAQRCSGVSPKAWLRRSALIWDAGTNPRRPCMPTINPPLLYPITLLSIISSLFICSSTEIQAICS